MVAKNQLAGVEDGAILVDVVRLEGTEQLEFGRGHDNEQVTR
jgi:hypothetical protein